MKDILLFTFMVFIVFCVLSFGIAAMYIQEATEIDRVGYENINSFISQIDIQDSVSIALKDGKISNWEYDKLRREYHTANFQREKQKVLDKAAKP